MGGKRTNHVHHHKRKQLSWEDPGKHKLISVVIFMEQIILEAISRHIKDETVVGKSQHDFVKEKCHLASLTTLCDEMPGSMDKGRTVNVLRLFARSSIYPSREKAEI